MKGMGCSIKYVGVDLFQYQFESVLQGRNGQIE